jgi:TetR/AcrR family transcriptional repressor of nem operon
MSPRRKEIIARAAGVVYRQGFGASTIADILKAATVGRGNFYHYFTGKEDLGLAIIDELGREIGGVDLDEIFSPLKLPMQRLSDYIEIVRKSCRHGNTGDPLCTLASELGATPPYAEHIRKAMHSLIDRVEGLISEFAVESNATVDANRLARIVVAQVHGLCTQFKVDRDVEALEAGLELVPDAVIHGIARAPRDGRPADPGRVQLLG